MFRRYPSIENAYRQKFIDAILINGWDKGVWYVTEKVHGANFSFMLRKDGTIECGKRSSPLAPSENFFGYQAIRDKLTSKLQKLQEDNFKGKQVTIYGELFGGYYNKLSTGTKVQDGVEYCSHNEFMMFDITVDGLYQPFNQVRSYAFEYDIPLVPVLYTGTFRECLEYPNEFITTIPKLYALPPLEGNTCEGTVIRPNDTLWWGVDNVSARIILKNKNAKFTEKEDKPTAIIKEFSPEIKDILAEVSAMVTDARIASVVSKIGEVTFSQFPMIMGNTVGDIIEEYNKDSDKISQLDKNEKKCITKELQKLIYPKVKAYLLKNS